MNATSAEKKLHEALKGTGDPRWAAEFLAALAADVEEAEDAINAMEYPPEVLLHVAMLARPRLHDMLAHEPDEAELHAFAQWLLPLRKACPIAVHCASSESSEHALRAALARERGPFMDDEKELLERGLKMVTGLAKARAEAITKHKRENSAIAELPLGPLAFHHLTPDEISNDTWRAFAMREAASTGSSTFGDRTPQNIRVKARKHDSPVREWRLSLPRKDRMVIDVVFATETQERGVQLEIEGRGGHVFAIASGKRTAPQTFTFEFAWPPIGGSSAGSRIVIRNE